SELYKNRIRSPLLSVCNLPLSTEHGVLAKKPKQTLELIGNWTAGNQSERDLAKTYQVPLRAFRRFGGDQPRVRVSVHANILEKLAGGSSNTFIRDPLSRHSKS